MADKLDQPEAYWDRLFAPSSCLAVITSVDANGSVNAAAYGTCTRVSHDPVYIAFTCRPEKDTARNLDEVGEFVVNVPRFDRESLEKVRVVGLPFARGVNELERARLTALPSATVRPPRIAECPRNFECTVEWTKDWVGRRMVVGKVTAVAADADCVTPDGYVVWDRVKPAHFCGAPYHDLFVAAYETMSVGMIYEGPEVAAFDEYERNLYARFEQTSPGVSA